MFNNDGWIKLHRKLLNNKIFFDSEKLQLFIYLLLMAAHEDCIVHGVQIKRGQLLIGRKRIAMDTRQKSGSIPRRLKYLENATMIEQQPNNQHTVITICNYDTYQEVRTTTEQRGKEKRTTTEQRPNTYKNNKNIRKKKEEEKIILSRFDQTLKDFEEHREKLRKPMTKRAKEMVLKKLETLSPLEENQIKILEQSIERGWQGVFPLQENNNFDNRPTIQELYNKNMEIELE